ncbi:hypothetical protein LCGC14_3165840 [marine sediment metagenome]|uniref:Uncharacterized protein n=1 Tax=marine sediment metagenome TaxID=412755 RepID=A0A0F8WAV4_9ZZZZ
MDREKEIYSQIEGLRSQLEKEYGEIENYKKINMSHIDSIVDCYDLIERMSEAMIPHVELTDIFEESQKFLRGEEEKGLPLPAIPFPFDSLRSLATGSKSYP